MKIKSTQSVRMMVCGAIALCAATPRPSLAQEVETADSSPVKVYVDCAATSRGNGSAARPYWRITDALEKARVARLGNPRRIVIRVAAGVCSGNFEPQPTTGALAINGTPTATGTSPYAIIGLDIGAGKRYVYVGNEGSNDVSAFTVSPTTGALTAVPGSPFAAGTDPQAMALYGPNFFAANAGSDNVSAYTIDAYNGALAGPSTIATGKSPTSIVVDNGIVFVATHGGSNDISAFYYDDLTPVPGSPFPAGGNPLSLALGAGAGGKFLYTANPDATNPSITGFSFDPTYGALSPLSGSPFPIPVSHYIATDQSGTYLYVTSGANVVGYGIDATTGSLTALPGFPAAAGANAYAITVDPTNQFLYVTNESAANIACSRLDASTGALTPMADSPFPAGSLPQSIATF